MFIEARFHCTSQASIPGSVLSKATGRNANWYQVGHKGLRAVPMSHVCCVLTLIRLSANMYLQTGIKSKGDCADVNMTIDYLQESIQ